MKDTRLGTLVWQAHQAAAVSDYLPARAWADLADQAWRLTVQHPEASGRLVELAQYYATHALAEADPIRRQRHSSLDLRRRSF